MRSNLPSIRGRNSIFHLLAVGIMMYGHLALILSSFAVGWKYLHAHKPMLSPARRQLVNEALSQVLSEIRAHRENGHLLVVVPFEGDATDYVTDRLRSEILRTGLFQLVDRPRDETRRKQLRLPLNGKGDLPSALAAARGTGAQAVLFGTAWSPDTFKDFDKIEVQVNLVRLDSGEVVFIRTYSRQLSFWQRWLVSVERGRKVEFRPP